MVLNVHCYIFYIFPILLFIAIVSSFYLKFSDKLLTSIAFLVYMIPVQKKKTCKKGKFIFTLSFQVVAHSRVGSHGIKSMRVLITRFVLMRKRVEYQCCTPPLVCTHFSTTLINLIYITL